MFDFSNSCGVAIIFKKGFDDTVLSKFEDPLGRYLILKAEIKEKLYVLINIYAPNKDKDIITFLNPFASGDFAEKRVLNLVEWFSGHCGAIKG